MSDVLKATYARCKSVAYGGLHCDLPAGHEGKHGEVMSRDADGRVDDAVTWDD